MEWNTRWKRLIKDSCALIISRRFSGRVHFNVKPIAPMNIEVAFKTYMCLICGFIYDEEAGLPEEGIAPGTRWEEVPPNWVCPECGARKEDFELVEI
jgi:rubredoxin